MLRTTKIFDQLDGLELTTKQVEMLEAKIKDMAMEYNERLLKLSIQNRLLSA